MGGNVMQTALEYIESASYGREAPGLGPMRAIFHSLGNPQKELKYVHIAGTNGKGSTAACIAAILRQAGYRVGLFTSPHLVRYHERIQVNDVPISDEELEREVSLLRPVTERVEGGATVFETLMALAVLHFCRKQCDIVVLEVGLGGMFDPTNVIDRPEAAVITALGLDHTAVLGSTLAEIAAAKAGIIKAGGKVVCYPASPEGQAVVEEVCRHQKATLTWADFSRIQNQKLTLCGSEFTLSPYGEVFLPLLGPHQCRNAAVAVTAIETLIQSGWRVAPSDVVRGLAQVRWPGRLEVLSTRPVFLLDGAHNLPGMESVEESLRTYVPQGGITFLVGAMADKDVSRMLTVLRPLAKDFIAVTAPNARAMEGHELAQAIRELGGTCQVAQDMEQAVALAMTQAGERGVVCALGTLYFSGEIRSAVAKWTERAKEGDR